MTTKVITKVLTPASKCEIGMHYAYNNFPVKCDTVYLFENKPIEII